MVYCTRTWYVRSMLFRHGLVIPLEAHVAVPGSTNTEGLTSRPVREDFLTICGRSRRQLVPCALNVVDLCDWQCFWLTQTVKWTNEITEKKKGTLPPRLTSYEEFFCSSEKQKKKRKKKNKLTLRASRDSYTPYTFWNRANVLGEKIVSVWVDVFGRGFTNRICSTTRCDPL